MSHFCKGCEYDRKSLATRQVDAHAKIRAVMHGIRSQNGGVAVNVVLGILIVFGLALLWQSSADKRQEELDAMTESTYVSPGGEFEITIPTSWKIGENSIEDEGIVFLELNGPRNSVVDSAFQDPDKDGGTSVEEFFGDERYRDILESSVGKEFALMQIEAVSANTFELASSREEWRNVLLSTATVASGISFGEFEEFSVTGGEGYVYDATAIENGNALSIRSYYLLGDQAEIEIILFPANSNFANEADDIVRSIQITTDAEAFED